MAARFHARLGGLRAVPGVGDVRGAGLLAGIELVTDRDTRAPFARSRKVAERVTEHALQEGLIVWPNGGQALNGDGDVIMLAPPFIITDDELHQLAERLGRAIERTVNEEPGR